MALKPDVTLSIVKNGKISNASFTKVFYDENVFRVSKATDTFKEIKQTGLECFGPIDDYQLLEVLSLAVESLLTISDNCVLSISQTDIVKKVLDYTGLSAQGKQRALMFLGAKNSHGLKSLCDSEGILPEKIEVLLILANAYGTLDKTANLLDGLLVVDGVKEDLLSLTKTVKILADKYGKDKIKIDFSVMQDMNYYNGIVFTGAVLGVPSDVLSGGQYDNLMSRLSKKAGAVGFAVYLDLLKRDYDYIKQDVTVVLYDDDTPIESVYETANKVKADGLAVRVEKTMPTDNVSKIIDLRQGK
jgi:ATP phosphoribosyltransferase regulatory subunit